MTNQEREPGKQPGNNSFWAQAAKYSEIAFIFPAASVAGLLVGVALDHWLHTRWLFLLGLVLGIVAGFVKLVQVGMSSGIDQ